MKSHPVIIKIGGNTIPNLDQEFYTFLHQLQMQNRSIIIIHGGGPMISSLSEQLHLPVVKKNGIRVTDATTLAIAKMVLLGQAQPLLAQQLSAHGFKVVCKNAAMNHLLTGQAIDQATYGSVGTITKVNQAALQTPANQITVLAPLALDDQGNWLNVNADEAAATIATLIHAEKLYLMTDVAGVLYEGHLIGQLNHHLADQLASSHVIRSGMVPKIKAAFKAKTAGVNQVFITNQLCHPGTAIN